MKLMEVLPKTLRDMPVVKLMLAQRPFLVMMSKAMRVRNTAVKKEHTRPMMRVVAKPLMGPEPKRSRITPVIMDVRLLAQLLAGAEFLFGAFKDKHVGIHRHTQGKHDTGYTGQGEHRLNGCEDT